MVLGAGDCGKSLDHGVGLCLQEVQASLAPPHEESWRRNHQPTMQGAHQERPRCPGIRCPLPELRRSLNGEALQAGVLHKHPNWWGAPRPHSPAPSLQCKVGSPHCIASWAIKVLRQGNTVGPSPSSPQAPACLPPDSPQGWSDCVVSPQRLS